jgi:hypothetical protein
MRIRHDEPAWHQGCLAGWFSAKSGRERLLRYRGRQTPGLIGRRS